MVSFTFLLSALFVACSPVEVGKEEAEMQEKLLTGSDYENNHSLLSEEGWLQVFGDKCIEGNSTSKNYVYVRGADPSYSLVLTYNSECKLQGTLIRERRVNEL